MQLRYETGLTGEEYVRAEAWRDARLERCPNHPYGGCSLAGHGTYARKTPRGAKIARWYCRESHTTFSLLPDCLAARLPGTLDALETVVAHAERSRSLTETAKALRRDAVGLAGAIRWVRRRVRLVCRLLASVAELLPKRFALGIAGLIPLRAHLDTGRALVELRRLLAPNLSVLPMPLGFCRHRSQASEIRPGFQHKLGHDPPPSAA
ncbi:MAG: hypothetical protein OXC15_06370 [Rhodospirillaceae bacterium]|nr:hypothetical protein [Rhodospirillaceae bacterium]